MTTEIAEAAERRAAHAENATVVGDGPDRLIEADRTGEAEAARRIEHDQHSLRALEVSHVREVVRAAIGGATELFDGDHRERHDADRHLHSKRRPRRELSMLV